MVYFKPTFWLLLSVLLSTLNKKRLKPLVALLEASQGAEGGTRTPMPFRAQRPERCVSTNFTTSAGLSCGQALYYCIPCALSRGQSKKDPSDSLDPSDSSVPKRRV